MQPQRRINYAKRLEYLINKLDGRRPSLLLHVCCAPCTSACIEMLAEHFEVTLLFYNPNIYPEEEYAFRAAELERLIAELDLKSDVKTVIDGYNPKEFYDAVKGAENAKEGGERCDRCFRLRLGRAASYAAENGFDYFCTTLTTGTRKNEQLINRIGEELSEIFSVKSLPADFKKKGGFDRSLEMSKQYNLYRQNYCGCVFSLNEAKERGEISAQTEERK